MTTYTLKDSIQKAKFAILDIFKIRQKKDLIEKKINSFVSVMKFFACFNIRN